MSRKIKSSSGTLSYAISCGRCIVSTPYVFAQDLIEKYKVGELIEYKNYKSVAKTLIKLITHPEKIAQYAKNAENYGGSIEWKKIGKKFEKVFEKVRMDENCSCRGR